jgi:hypothetical protein
MTLLTTLVTPPLLRLALTAAKDGDSVTKRVAASTAE